MTEQVEQWVCIIFCVKLPPWKLFRWSRSPLLWAAGDWQPHYDNVPAHASRLVQSFLAKHQIIQVTQPLYSPAVVLCTSGFSQNSNHLWKGDFRPLMRFRKPSQSSWWRLGELCEVPRCLPWRGLRRCCPVYNVSCILYLLHIINVYFSYYMAGYFLDRPRICRWHDLVHRLF